MKTAFFFILFCSLQQILTLPSFQVSILSSLSTKLTRHEFKEFINCEEKKKILLAEDCKTEGQDNDKICKDYKKKLEKQLDCQDSCQDFYTKYNEIQVERAEEQKKFYSGKKDKERAADKQEEIEDLKKNKDIMVGLACGGDTEKMSEQLNSNSNNDKDEKDKKEKK